MGLHSMEGMDEYAVFLVTNRGENVFTNGHRWNNEFLLTKWVKRMWPIWLITGTCESVGQNVQPLSKREYILDVTTEAELIDSNYNLWFRRVIWNQPLKFDSELGVTMHYNQVLYMSNHTAFLKYNNISIFYMYCLLMSVCLTSLFVPQVTPDYLKSLLNVVSQGRLSEQQLQQVSKLAALQHRAKDTISLPSL